MCVYVWYEGSLSRKDAATLKTGFFYVAEGIKGYIGVAGPDYRFHRFMVENCCFNTHDSVVKSMTTYEK